MRSTLVATLLSTLALAGCADPGGEDTQLPDELDDGKLDTLASPTSFGPLYPGMWQYGELDPSSKVRNVAWDFELTGDAKIDVVSRIEPSAEPDVTASVMYLYKKGSGSTWRKVVRTTDGGEGDMAGLARELGKGKYRVIVKGLHRDDAGSFMVHFACSGAGCPASDPCVLGESVAALRQRKYGSFTFDRESDVTATTMYGSQSGPQFVALAQALGLDATSPADVFRLIADGKIHSMWFTDELRGALFRALTIKLDGQTKGFFMAEGQTELLASITGNRIDECTLTPRICRLGRQMGDAEFMPGARKVSSRTLRKASDVTSDKLKAQILATTRVTQGGDEPYHTLAEAFENVDDNTFYVDVIEIDGKTYTDVNAYSGDTACGYIFEGDTTKVVAEGSDGDLLGCQAF